MVLGQSSDNESFIATNATNFPQGVLNGTLTVGLTQSQSGECTTEAYDNLLPFQLNVPVAFVINQLGMIEGENENGWFTQTIRELEGDSTLPITLAELLSGVSELVSGVAELFNVNELDYGLAVYALGAEEEVLGCASMKKVDEDTTAEYDEAIFGLSQEEAVMDVPSSARKNGLFVFVSAIAAVGIVAVLGDMLAL